VASAVSVGNYECLDLATTRTQLAAIGLLLGTVLPGDGVEYDPWLVITQSPAPAEVVAPGTGVDLVLGDPADPCPPA